MNTYDPHDSAVQQCPFPAYQAMRSAAPVLREQRTGWWFVTRHVDVLDVLRRPQVFSSRVGKYLRPPPPPELAEKIAAVRMNGWPEAPVLVVEDPPLHRQQRILVQRAFSPRRVASMEPDIRTVAKTLIGALPDGETFDVVDRLAVPLPLEVISAALRIPQARHADFKRWSDNRVRMIGAALTEEVQLEIAWSEVERQTFFNSAFEDRRANPQDDLMTDLVQARIEEEDGRALTDEELLAIIGQVLAAGNESTTKVLTETLLQLSRKPEVWAWLREDPAGRAATIFEEGLRMACPFQVLLRVVTADTLIAGVPIAEGDIVAIAVGSAARDEAVFDDPEDFVIREDGAPDSLAFGSGIHRCVGAGLAKLELSVMLEEMAHHFDRLEPVETAARYDPSFMLRGISHLDLRARRC